MQYSKLLKNSLLLFCVFAMSQLYAQDKSVVSLFKNLADEFQEVTYSHLNKSIYAQGEHIGFTTYIFDLKTKTPSYNTKNVYVKILNNAKEVIDEQLLSVENGIASGKILLDKKYQKGNYTFIAFTNWMQNFSEHNMGMHSFKVLNIDDETIVNRNKIHVDNLDIQLLPESGHFLNETINTVGVVVKDSLGFGIPNIKATVFNDKDSVTTFKLNKLGIGRFSVLIDSSKKYRVVFNVQEDKIEKYFAKKIETHGFLISAKELNNHCYISVSTNNASLKKYANQTYYVTIHNGFSAKKTPISFSDLTTITLKIPLTELATGISVLTLFNAKNQPLAERLFFNYKGLKVLKSNTYQLTKKDTTVTLNFKSLKNYNTLSNVSVSILPKNTVAYKHNHTMISQLFLQPYVKGTIENGAYYFTTISKKTKYDLDNLLITQGWSSFDWSTIFEASETEKTFDFETGITLQLKIPEKEKITKLVLHGSAFNSMQFVDIYKNTKQLEVPNYKPFNDEVLHVSKIDFKGTLDKTRIDVDFYPKQIPPFKPTKIRSLPVIETFAYEDYLDFNTFSKQNSGEILNGISITTNREKLKQLKIKSKALGRVFFIDKNEKKQTLANFLNTKPGIIAFDNLTNSKLVVRNKRSNADLRVVLNGLQVSEYLLFNYWMDVVEYVEVDTSIPMFSRKMHSGGTVRIKTKDNVFNKAEVTVSEFKFPLTFTKSKKFYAPKYESYQSSFFKKYGVIDWLPKNQIDKNGQLMLKLPKLPLKSVKLFVEGVTNDGIFIFDERIVKLK